MSLPAMKRTRIYAKPGTYLNGLLSPPRTCAAVALLARAPSESLAEILAIVGSLERVDASSSGHNLARHTHASAPPPDGGST
jgi:hypothetical protein